MEKTVFPPSGKNLSTLQRANHYTTPPLQRNFFSASIGTDADSPLWRWKPHDAAVNFTTYQNLQWHHAVLPAIARLSCINKKNGKVTRKLKSRRFFIFKNVKRFYIYWFRGRDWPPWLGRWWQHQWRSSRSCSQRWQWVEAQISPETAHCRITSTCQTCALGL